MNSFVSWLDRPFHPDRISKRGRRQTGFVTIRYRGSFTRSAVKALIVVVLLAVLSNVIGERTAQNLGADEVAAKTWSAGTPR
jgi:hypothetical protein